MRYIRILILLCITAIGVKAQTVTPEIDNRIYVDGVKYPLTQPGIQQAFNDACAIGGNAASTLPPGTTVYLPPMIGTFSTGWIITCPLRVLGAGKGFTVITILNGNAVTYRPNGFFGANQNFEWAYTGLTAGNGDAILLDSSNGSGAPGLLTTELISITTSWFPGSTTGQWKPIPLRGRTLLSMEELSTISR
ncbi:MAG TPA: hypothetical protein VN682_20310 [Terriglobales bacterium]|nr:hypothetical protein [Terriglobales bacterium]